MTKSSIEDTAVVEHGHAASEQWLRSEVPSELAQAILMEFDEDNLEKLAQAAFAAELAEVQPNPTYADITARGLALGSLRRALGLKPMTDETEALHE